MSSDNYYQSFLNRVLLIHIVDTDSVSCESLILLFRLEGYQTNFSMEAAHLVLSLDRRRPDIIVLNLKLGNVSGLQLLEQIKSKHTGVPVIMLSDQPSVDIAVSAMKLGATDLISKPIDTVQLLSNVRNSLMRHVRVGAMQGGRRPVEVNGFSQLTAREREVLQLITNGQSNKEAGRDLGISPRTIKVHRARIIDKLCARNTADRMPIVLTS